MQDQLKKEAEANTKRTYSYREAHKREKEQLEKEHAAAMEACKKDYRVVYDRLSQQLTLDKENLQKEYATLKIEIITSKSTAAAIQNGDSASAQNSELQQLKSQIQEIEKVTLLNSELEFSKKQVIQRETDILQLNNEVNGLQENAQLLQQAKVNITRLETELAVGKSVVEAPKAQAEVNESKLKEQEAKLKEQEDPAILNKSALQHAQNQVGKLEARNLDTKGAS